MPEISVLVPALGAEKTLSACLRSIASQTFQDFELIVIVSGGQVCRQIARIAPRASFLAFDEPLLPHEALNRGLKHAAGRLLAFTDADAYPEPDWLQKLVAAHQTRGPVIFGGVACYGSAWLDRGAHLCKFDKWLAGGHVRTVNEGPTVNMLLERQILDEAGPFREDTIHADTDMSWRLRRAGYPLWFDPAAVVTHHHLHSWRGLLRERYARGRAFAQFETSWVAHGHPTTLMRAMAGILPLRLASQVVRILCNARRARQLAGAVTALPVIGSGLYAWLLGESLSRLRFVLESNG